MEIPIIMKLTLRIITLTEHFIPIRHKIVTMVAGPVRKGAGNPITDASRPPMLPISTVNVVGARLIGLYSISISATNEAQVAPCMSRSFIEP